MYAGEPLLVLKGFIKDRMLERKWIVLCRWLESCYRFALKLILRQLLQLFMASQDGGIQQFACTLLVRPVNTDLSSLHRVLLLERHFKLVVQLLLIFVYLHLNDLIVQELIIGYLSWLGLRTHRAFVSVFYSIIIDLITDEDRIDSLLCFGQFFDVFLEIIFGIY